MTVFALRPYQAEAVDAVTDFMYRSEQNPVIVLPTGAGKTIVVAELVKRYLSWWPETRVLVLAHVKELVRQNAEKLLAYWPELWPHVGIHSAGLRRRDRFEKVIFASVQSVWKKASHLGRFDLILVDEAHRIPVEGEGMYRRLIADARAINPRLRVIGLTATPYRLGVGYVYGPDYVLNDVAYEAPVGDLIRDGYLCRLRSMAGSKEARADIQGVHIRQGDYVAAELDEALSDARVVNAAMDEVLTQCRDRRHWILFCAGVRHAGMVSAALAARGIEAPVVHGGTPREERDRIIGDYYQGKLRAIVNINVLSEGFDAPHVDAICLLRPTQSTGLYYQQVGRGLRLHPDKADCLVLDFTENVLSHGPIDRLRVRRPKDPSENVGPLAKECRECHALVPIQARECPECGYELTVAEPATLVAKHAVRASEAPVLSDEAAVPPQWVDVEGWALHVHRKRNGDGPPTMRVEYRAGLQIFKEWIGVEHTGYARWKAGVWWRRVAPGVEMPETVEETVRVLGQRGQPPRRIKVAFNDKYPRVVDYDTSREVGAAAPDRAFRLVDQLYSSRDPLR